jgi:hypothetical protein
LAWLLILLIAFNVFNAFAVLLLKVVRRGKETLFNIARKLDLGLEAPEDWHKWVWSG